MSKLALFKLEEILHHAMDEGIISLNANDGCLEPKISEE